MLGVSMAKWRLMRADKRLPRRIEAIEQAELRIAVFAVEMAGAEAVNAAIAGRILDQLGLAQKQTVETVEHDDNVKRMRNSELQKAAERSNGYRPWTGRS